MDDEQREELAGKLVGSMEAVMRATGAVFREELERYGTTFPQMHLLKMADFHKGVTVTELAHMMMVAPPTASRMIESLCSRGLLKREKDAGDQRVTHVILTGEGRRVLRDIEGLQVSLMLDLLEGIGDEDLKVFIGILDRFTGARFDASGENN